MSKLNNEEVKVQSNYLRGTLAEELANDLPYFSDAAKLLIKFHGSYEQEDRDSRKERKLQKLEPLYFVMVRSRLPGGKMTPDQYLVHDELAGKYANGTIRLTSRQGIQFHGILKKDMKAHLRALNDALVTTLAACGDVNRNVLSCPAPIRNDSIRDEMQAMCDRITQHFLPRGGAYHDIWLNGAKLPSTPLPEEPEPLYGKTYLPRKFKTALGLPEDNCVDVLSNDLGLVVSHRNGRIEGYNIYAGGGHGVTHGQPKTYPRLATPVCFATPDEALGACEAVLKVQRDFGNRQDRKQARLKYTVDRMGVEGFREKVIEYFGKPLQPYNGEKITGVDDHLGWHEQGDGKLWVGVRILGGRIMDDDRISYRSTLRKIVSQYRPNVRVTAKQNILLCDIAPTDRSAIEKLLIEGGFKKPEELPKVFRHGMACVALPTCALALADSERVFDQILGGINEELASQGLSNEDVVVHMTGCPNGCARPFNADIGIVGRSPGKYVLYLGGNMIGDELAFQYQDLVPIDQIPARLRGPIAMFKAQRQPGEGFGPFCKRVGKDALLSWTTQAA
jgi:sulfite reductase (ferredoxin)